MTEKKAPQFTKTELLSATSLSGAQRDQLMVALDKHKMYTLDEAKAAVQALKGGLF
ncbi:hypothetical protein [Lacticaseibacillus sharpeae]|uniref:Uncharacterized protein n=1 Tax=Lacticaseibacillus sharpeae JCM 1186 = DSM 20505 TaxID=1291052 RepID=A0A0R1ZIF5_9LACO|nr:hypothetical protein [Lacticaseibacillus sharpeae]KRM54621.1 hypothetical protein FC18_GL002331 [Lacticaseibacillus sharpeae JCM 1186 = DSM 20505]